MQEFGDKLVRMSKYDTIFVDSITVAGRLCFQYCMSHPDNIAERSGKLILVLLMVCTAER